MGFHAVISVEIDTSQLEKKLAKLERILPNAMERSVWDIMDFIQNQANRNIDQDLKWGHSFNQAEQIRNCWKKEITERTAHTVKGTLSNNSPHARIVEYGGVVKTTIEREPGLTPFPIGLQQGNIVAFADKFELQEGKYYLTKATFENLPAIEEIARKNIGTAIICL